MSNYTSLADWEELSHKDLVREANAIFDLGVKASVSKPEILKMIAPLLGEQDVPKELPSEVMGRGKYCKIMVYKDPGSSKSRPLFIGVNGDNVLIPREEEVIVHEKYVNVLENAVESYIEQDEDMSEERVETRYSYKFTVLERGLSKPK